MSTYEEQWKEQDGFFFFPPPWKEHWKMMPSFSVDDLKPDSSLLVHFESYEDREKFSQFIGQKLTSKTKFVWFPKRNNDVLLDKRYVSDDPVGPRYPVYIVSKGRWESRLTVKSLDYLKVPYKIVIEPQEYANYAEVIDPSRILQLPFSNLGQGSIPARNWIWQHSIDEGHERHWILDDNIRHFYRFHNNRCIRVADGTIFRAAEDFVDRYENVGLAGFNYEKFVPKDEKRPPFYLNTRIYSCILIRNDLPHRWRGKYNEDTDLSLNVLKTGQCTILFNAFLAGKVTTMTMKGGNTDELYAGEGRLKMAKSLEKQHPDVVKVVWKWDRWQHQVDYSKFARNKLKLKSNKPIPEVNNDYGMRLHLIKRKGK